MATVFLVRHGRTKANADGVLAGWSPGVFLDEVGEGQAKAVGERLRPVPLTAIVASPLDRTQQTADAIADGRDIARHTDERFGECRYGDWTGRPLKDLAKDPAWSVVQSHPSAAVFPSGESMAAMQHRAVSAVRSWNESVGPEGLYAVVSHGDVIKAILADALGMHLDQFQRIAVDPCSVSIIRYTTHRPFVLTMNDTGGDLGAYGAKPKRRRGRASSDAPVGGGAGR